MRGRIFLLVAALTFVVGILFSALGIMAAGSHGKAESVETSYTPQGVGGASGCC